MPENKVLEFEIKYKLGNTWSIVELLGIAIAAVLLVTYATPVAATVATVAWLAGRVVSWCIAKSLLSGFKIAVTRDDDSDDWKLVDY